MTEINPFEIPTYTVTDNREADKLITSLYNESRPGIKDEYSGTIHHFLNEKAIGVIQEALLLYSVEDRAVMVYLSEMNNIYGLAIIMNPVIRQLVIQYNWSRHFGNDRTKNLLGKDLEYKINRDKLFSNFAAWRELGNNRPAIDGRWKFNI